MAGKAKKVYFVNPTSQGNTVWAAPSKGHEDGKYILGECGQSSLEFLYETVNNRNDIYFTEMTAEELKLMEKGVKKREEMAAKSAKESKVVAKKKNKEPAKEEAEGASE